MLPSFLPEPSRRSGAGHGEVLQIATPQASPLEMLGTAIPRIDSVALRVIAIDWVLVINISSEH